MKKNTKSALLLSVVSVIICCTMLLGTTMAWFTDSVTSDVNKIIAGNLDVELYRDSIADANKVNGDTKLFNEVTLWEPGVVLVENLIVANKGNLALEYQLTLDVLNATDNGNGGTLADVIKVALVEGGFTGDRAEAQKLTYKDLDKFVKNGTLDITQNVTSETVGIVLYWAPSDNDNDYNMNNGKTPEKLTIDLGVTLVATQLTAEMDSFDEKYDTDAEYPEVFAASYTVTTADEFKTALENAGKLEGSVLITLAGNVEWETGASHGSTPLIPKDGTADEVVIDGQGTYTLTATGAGVGPIRAANGGVLKFRNLEIIDDTESYAEGSWEFGYLEFADGEAELLVFENVTFKKAIMVDGIATFNNCYFNSNADNEYAVWVAGGDATFTNCTFEGPRGLKTHEDYSSEVGTIIVDNCAFGPLSKKPGVAIGDLNAATTVTIKNSTFIKCQPGDQNMYIYESDTDVTTFSFTLENNELINGDVIEIGTVADLEAFAKSVNVDGNGHSGDIIKLTADIDLGGVEWTPIGQTGGYGIATYFQGTFDGQGYTISNFKITNTNVGANYAAGLFGFIDAADATIKNLKVTNATVNGHHWTGVIAGYITGTIINCEVTDSSVVCTHANNDACGDKAGVITGYVNSGIVTGNTVKNCTVAAGRDGGQVAGAAKTTQVYGNTIENVTVSATENCTGANINNAEIGRIL